MQIDVLLKPSGEDGYTATVGKPFDVTAHGTTEEETLACLRERVEETLAGGAKVVPMTIPSLSNAEIAWEAGRGMFKDDPLFDDWLAAIAEFRRQRDADDERQDEAQAAA